MQDMRILSIGVGLPRTLVDHTQFNSTVSFLDYDVVICDIGNALAFYNRAFLHQTYMGYPSLDDDSSVRLREDIKRRRTEMEELLKLGRFLIIVTPPPILCYVATGETRTSGTGRNARVTRIVTEADLLNSLPVHISTIAAQGQQIEFRGGEPFRAFWEKVKDYLAYEAYFQNPVGQPLLFVKDTEKVVGSYSQIAKGHLLFVPSLQAMSDAKYKAASKSFLESLLTLFDSLKESTGDFQLPGWTSEYLLPDEEGERNQLQNLEGDLAALLARITEQKDTVAKLEQYKILFCGSGRALEVQVKRVLEEIGFEVGEGGLGRDDLILKYGDQVAVAEVKGVTKSAAEKHAAQLEKWVSEYYSANEIQPKGILIVNSFKDKPLPERGDAFPHQMRGYSERREHCLVTSLQLLGLYYDIQNNPERKDELIQSLLGTEGVYEKYNEWNTFLTTTETTNLIEHEK